MIGLFIYSDLNLFVKEILFLMKYSLETIIGILSLRLLYELFLLFFTETNIGNSLKGSLSKVFKDKNKFYITSLKADIIKEYSNFFVKLSWSPNDPSEEISYYTVSINSKGKFNWSGSKKVLAKIYYNQFFKSPFYKLNLLELKDFLIKKNNFYELIFYVKGYGSLGNTDEEKVNIKIKKPSVNNASINYVKDDNGVKDNDKTVIIPNA